MKQKKDVAEGTLARMVRKTLGAPRPLYGYGVARRIEQISGELLSLNRAIASEWSPSERSRRARFYRLTHAGHKLLEAEKRDGEQTAAIIARFFEVKARDLA
jgi:PadR family transcriptional regulator PadR